MCVGVYQVKYGTYDSSFQTGRKLVFRSEPPRHKKKEDVGADQASAEEEMLAYFFTWW